MLRFFYPLTQASLVMLLLASFAGIPPVSAQESLLQDRWLRLESENFVVFSQVSAGRTERFARDLEIWRKVAAYFVNDGNTLPVAAVDNQVFLFAEQEGLDNFIQANERGFFYATPRRNFMAVIHGDEDSLVQARHHYLHFIMRNFADLLIPRWYEEGLAGYLSNLTVNRGQITLNTYSRQVLDAMQTINDNVTLAELMYDEGALSSPRLVQIANIKAEFFLYFLWHSSAETGFTDYRPQLERLLDLALEGRSPRYSFDQAFDLSTSQLDSEFMRYLEATQQPEIQLSLGEIQVDEDYSTDTMGYNTVANLLAELSLNTGNFTLAETFFQAAIDQESAIPRSYAGMADALRMQELETVTDDTLSGFYQQALDLAPDDLDSLLDYGEYLETTLADCELSLDPQQENATQNQILNYFQHAIELAPENAEANLAMGQYYLLQGQDYRKGIRFQNKASDLLPGDSFIMEQAVKYRIAEGSYNEAQRLIDELSQPLHFWVEPPWVSNLRREMQHHQQGLAFDACEHGV